MSKLSTIAKRYRDKYGKEMPTLKLARIIHKENKLSFSDAEHARTVLRYIEGKKGGIVKKRKSKSKDAYYVEDSRPRNPYQLPDSDAKDLPPFLIKGHTKALIIGDVHLPYHNVDAITSCFDYAKKEKPDLVILNGDIIDCHSLSKFVHDPKARKFPEELVQLTAFVESIKKTFKCRILYKFGNHEIRYQHFLWQKVSELDGVEEFDLKNIIQRRAAGVEIIGDKTIIMLNELAVLHGHEFGKSIFSPVNVARGLHLRAKVSAIQAHHHKTSEHTETDLHGIIKTTWSIGCLCALKPEYSPYNSWNNGFCIVDIDNNGVNYRVHNKRIYRGKIL